MKRVIIVGSPRARGRSAHLAEMLFEANIDERPQDELFLVPISEIDVAPCIGCNACRQLTAVMQEDESSGREISRLLPRCIFDDDMQTVYDLLDDADDLAIVSPIYFSGTPAPLKCLLDRLQPYFWANIATGWQGTAMEKGKGKGNGRGSADADAVKGENEPESEDAAEPAPYVPRRNRPLTLHVLGEGGDPHGFDPLVSEVKSSLACAGFTLTRVLDWVGKVTPEGEITAEATETEIAKPQANAVKSQPQPQADAAKPKQRPKLDLSQGQKPKPGKDKKGRNRGR